MQTGTPPTEVEHDGIRVLRWRGAGLPGAPLVFLHGLGDGADIWDVVLKSWPHGPMAAIAPDLPGHGGSKRLKPRDYRMSQMTDIVAKTLEREMVRQPVLIGHSLGGRIALELAASGRVNPERVVLVDVNPDPSESVGDAVSEHLDVLMSGAPDMSGFVGNLLKRMPLSSREILERALPPMAAAGATPGAPGIRLNLDPEIKRLLNAPLESDGWALLAALGCPVSILRGGFSSALDATTARRMSERTRKPSPVITVPKSGHAIAFEQPAALAEALAKAINPKS